MATLKIPRGTTYAIDVVYKKNGVAATLVGATIRFTVKAEEWDTDADDDPSGLIRKNVTSHTDAANGLSTITLTDTDTYLDPDTYHYDIKVEEVDGDIYKLDEGTVVIDGSPTNRTS